MNKLFFVFIIMIITSCNTSSNDKQKLENLLKTMPPQEVIEELSKRDDSAEKFQTLAISYSMLKEFDKSEEFYQKSLKIEKTVKLILNYSMLKAKKGEYKEALKMLKEIQKDDYISGKITLAQLYVVLNSPDRAIDVLKNIDKSKLNIKEMKEIVSIYSSAKSSNLVAEMYEYYIGKKDAKNISRIKKLIKNLRI